MKYLTEMTYKDACRRLHEEKQIGKRPEPDAETLEVYRRRLIGLEPYDAYSNEFADWANSIEVRSLTHWLETKAGRVWSESVEREKRRLQYKAGFEKHLARVARRNGGAK